MDSPVRFGDVISKKSVGLGGLLLARRVLLQLVALQRPLSGLDLASGHGELSLEVLDANASLAQLPEVEVAVLAQLGDMGVRRSADRRECLLEIELAPLKCGHLLLVRGRSSREVGLEPVGARTLLSRARF